MTVVEKCVGDPELAGGNYFAKGNLRYVTVGYVENAAVSDPSATT